MLKLRETVLLLRPSSAMERSIGANFCVGAGLAGETSEPQRVLGTGGRTVAVDADACDTEALFALWVSDTVGEGRGAGAAEGVFQSAKSRGCCFC